MESIILFYMFDFAVYSLKIQMLNNILWIRVVRDFKIVMDIES